MGNTFVDLRSFSLVVFGAKGSPLRMPRRSLAARAGDDGVPRVDFWQGLSGQFCVDLLCWRNGFLHNSGGGFDAFFAVEQRGGGRTWEVECGTAKVQDGARPAPASIFRIALCRGRCST